MKKKYYIVTAIASYFLFLIASIPARPVTDFLNNNSTLALHGVNGTLWNGRAYAVSINNTVRLQKTEWSFRLWKLITGRIAMDVSAQYSGHNIDAEIGMSLFGNYFVSDLSGKIPADDVAEITNIPLAQLSGLISVSIEYAYWKPGEFPVASGQVNWNDATVTVADTASLGNILITLSESEQNLLNADIKNQGGDIAIAGTGEIVPEAGYLVSLRLSPTTSASASIVQSLAMFAKKQKNGDYVFNQTGKLSDFGFM